MRKYGGQTRESYACNTTKHDEKEGRTRRRVKAEVMVVTKKASRK